MKDYYRILEVDPQASLEVLNNAYRALVRKYHPDLYHVSHKERMNSRLQDINEAYRVLSEPASRAAYDRRYAGQAAEPSHALADRRSIIQVLIRMLAWGIGTYVVIRFLIKPLLISPVFKFLLLGVGVYLLYRVYGRRQAKP